MARLRHPESGTVVSCGDDLAALYRSQGWVEADADTRPVEAAPEKPQPARRRAKATS